MSGGALARWWRSLWSAPGPAVPAPPPDRAPLRGSTDDGEEAVPSRTAPRRHYTAPPRHDDPQREAHLGAVLQALSGGPLRPAELAYRVGAADWGRGDLDAIVSHGVATGVLVEGDDGTVRARYAD